jgi:hypothetical protein
VSAASLSRYGTLEVRFFRTLGFCPRYDFKRLDSNVGVCDPQGTRGYGR